MASSPYEKLLELARQRATDGKGGLAASVAEMCLTSKSDLSERELELAFEILRLLVDKVEVKIRRHIADYLAERNDVPQDLIQLLAHDDLTVAYPIILHSTLLQDSDLLEIIVSGSTHHRQAVAVRPGITAPITDKLVDFEEAEVLTTLLGNETAEISVQSMEKLVEQSLEIEALQEPLAHRKEMTPVLAQRMVVWVGDALREFIVSNYQVGADTIAETVGNVVNDTFNAASAEVSLTAPTAVIDAASTEASDFAAGRTLLRFLNAGDISGFETAFASQLHLPLQAMAVILYDSGLETLAVASKAAGLDQDVFAEILCYLSGVHPTEDYKSSEEFSRTMAYFNSIDHAGASVTVNRWRSTPQQARRA